MILIDFINQPMSVPIKNIQDQPLKHSITYTQKGTRILHSCSNKWFVLGFFETLGKVPLIRGSNTREPNYNQPLKSRLETHCRGKVVSCNHNNISLKTIVYTTIYYVIRNVRGLKALIFNAPQATKKNTLLSIVKYTGNPIFLSKKEFGSVAKKIELDLHVFRFQIKLITLRMNIPG